MDDKRITKKDFSNLKEMPKMVIQFKVENPFNNLEMALIHKGHKATEMEDKWNFYMEGKKVYLHRSWTGVCCYILEFDENDENMLVTANNKKDEQNFLNNDGSDDFYKEIVDYVYQAIKTRLNLEQFMFNPQKSENTEDKSYLTRDNDDEDIDQLIIEGKAVRYDVFEDEEYTEITNEEFNRLAEEQEKKQTEKLSKQMLGAVVGDIVGSVYEFNNIKTKQFNLFSPKCFFTDDTVMTFAILKALLDCKGKYKSLEKYATKEMLAFGKKYPNKSYGDSFRFWLTSRNPEPYNSFGNGSAMRISAVPYFARDLEEVKELSYLVTKPTHNHPEGIKGAEATAVAIWLALQGKTKVEIKDYIEQNYYKLNFKYDDLVQNYSFNETCQNTVPQAIFCFLISRDFEDAIRIGISIGGDSDTLCAITGAIAEAYYGMPESISNIALQYLDKNLLKIYEKFKKITKNTRK